MQYDNNLKRLESENNPLHNLDELRQQFENQKNKARENKQIIDIKSNYQPFHHLSLQSRFKAEIEGSKSPRESVNMNFQENEDKFQRTFYNHEIENTYDIQKCIESYKHYPQKYPKERQAENAQLEEEYCEHEQSSEKLQSPVRNIAKPPIYRKSKRSNGSNNSLSQEQEPNSDKDEDRKERDEEERDTIEENLQEVAESLNGIRRNIQQKHSFGYSHSDSKQMIFERIPIEQLIEWNQILEETSKEELDYASMEYKNEILKLASLISDVLSPDSI